MTQNSKLQNKKLLASLIIALSVVSSLLGYVTFSTSTASEHTTLGLKVSPEGTSFKISVNQSKTFLAQALNGTAPFTYTWTISPTGNFTLSINGNITQVSNASALKVTGDTLTLLYPNATEQFVSVDVSVKDFMGLSGSLLTPIVVADPYNSPGYKFDASTASASYIVTADGSGWFRVTKGLDGSVISAWTSTNAGAAIQKVFTAIGDGEVVYLKSGTYPVASALSLTSKNNVEITGDKGAVLSCSGQINIIELTNNDGVTISSITLDGNKASYTYGGNSSRQHGIYLESSNDTVIDGVSFRETFGAGFMGVGGMHTTHGVTVKNCDFESCGATTTISAGGVYTYYIDEVTVVDNKFNNDYSIHVAFLGDETAKVWFKDFTCSRNYMNGTIDSGDSCVLDVLYGANFTITDNKIYNSYTTGLTADGIRAEVSYDGIIANNVLMNNYAGIYVYLNSHEILITHNIITKNRFRGIMIQESNYVTVSENIIKDNTHWGISVVDYSNETKILYNTLSGNLAFFGTSEIAFVSLGTNPQFVGNDGCIFENSGTFTGLSDGSSVNHELIDTPLMVLITVDGTNSVIAGVPYKGATYFTLSLKYVNGTSASGINGSWIAIYTPPHL